MENSLPWGVVAQRGSTAAPRADPARARGPSEIATPRRRQAQPRERALVRSRRRGSRPLDWWGALECAWV